MQSVHRRRSLARLAMVSSTLAACSVFGSSLPDELEGVPERPDATFADVGSPAPADAADARAEAAAPDSASPPPAVEWIGEGERALIDFAVDADALYTLVEGAGVRRASIPNGVPSVVLTANADYRAPLAVFAGQVYTAEHYEETIFPGVDLPFFRLIGVRDDGSDYRTLRKTMLDIAPRAQASAAGVIFASIRAAGDEAVDNLLEQTRPTEETPVQLDRRRAGNRTMLYFDERDGMLAYAYANVLRVRPLDADGGPLQQRALAGIVQLAIDAGSVYALLSSGSVVRCTLDLATECVSVPLPADLLPATSIAATGGRLLLVMRPEGRAERLWTCADQTCSEGPAVGMPTLDGLRRFGAHVYLAASGSASNAAVDAGLRWRVARLNLP